MHILGCDLVATTDSMSYKVKDQTGFWFRGVHFLWRTSHDSLGGRTCVFICTWIHVDILWRNLKLPPLSMVAFFRIWSQNTRVLSLTRPFLEKQFASQRFILILHTCLQFQGVFETTGQLKLPLFSYQIHLSVSIFTNKKFPVGLRTLF